MLLPSGSSQQKWHLNLPSNVQLCSLEDNKEYYWKCFVLYHIPQLCIVVQLFVQSLPLSGCYLGLVYLRHPVCGILKGQEF